MAVDITVLNLLSAELDPVIMEITKSLKQLPQKTVIIITNVSVRLLFGITSQTFNGVQGEVRLARLK